MPGGSLVQLPLETVGGEGAAGFLLGVAVLRYDRLVAATAAARGGGD